MLFKPHMRNLELSLPTFSDRETQHEIRPFFEDYTSEDLVKELYKCLKEDLHE